MQNVNFGPQKTVSYQQWNQNIVYFNHYVNIFLELWRSDSQKRFSDCSHAMDLKSVWEVVIESKMNGIIISFRFFLLRWITK